jgi:PKD repeat protein
MEQSQHLETIFRNAIGNKTIEPSEKLLRKLKARLWFSDFLSVNPRKMNFVYTTILLGGVTAFITLNPFEKMEQHDMISAPSVSETQVSDKSQSASSVQTGNEPIQFAKENEAAKPTGAFSALFNTSTQNGCAPLTVQFTSHAAPGVTWHWDFGNGDEADVQNPVYTYTKAGQYKASLTVKNSSGQQDTYLQEIVVLRKPVARFDLDIGNSDIEKKNLIFNNKSEGAESYIWDFGDSRPVVSNRNVHTYPDYGVYKVTLIASADNGCSDTVSLLTRFIEKNYELSFPLNIKPNPVEANNWFY